MSVYKGLMERSVRKQNSEIRSSTASPPPSPVFPPETSVDRIPRLEFNSLTPLKYFGWQSVSSSRNCLSCQPIGNRKSKFFHAMETVCHTLSRVFLAFRWVEIFISRKSGKKEKRAEREKNLFPCIEFPERR